MAKLRRSLTTGKGIARKRQGRGFRYVDAVGQKVDDPEILERISELVIPPAWQDVWISPYTNGHIQAVGLDGAGRKQYLYHAQWRREQDELKHDHALVVAKALPQARERASEDLAASGYPRRKVLATAFRLLDLGFFRVGGETYAEANGSYGLSTLHREHVTVAGAAVEFDYPAKSGKQRMQTILDEQVRAVVIGLLRRKDENPELLAYKTGQVWKDIRSSDVNEYVKEVLGVEASAKDFRTWHATVLMSVALAVSAGVADSPTKRRRAESRAYQEVAQYLGNTPAVARRSYVDPRVVDLFEDGVTIGSAIERMTRTADDTQPILHGTVERAVLAMLSRA